MDRFNKGDRVQSLNETELGPGVILEVNARKQIVVFFEKSQVTRIYNAALAPLAPYAEMDSSGTQPVEHFISKLKNQLNSGPEWFDLRAESWHLKNRALNPLARGLMGARCKLLPHQIFVAHEIAHRQVPRVLLGDEVGLGKTIEAGMIYSSLRGLDRAGRVLVIVPDSLKHQWLTEFYRRFGDLFSVIDKARFEEEGASQSLNAFRMNQRIICSLDFLMERWDFFKAALSENWDLLIVDEAHHLEWDPVDPSQKWRALQELSQRSRGVLLLTATPSLLGAKTQFGLLQLIDPARYSDFATFEKSLQSLGTMSDAAKALLQSNRDPDFLGGLSARFSGDLGLLKNLKLYEKGAAPDALLRSLMDRHGVGRVLIRNRRERIQGFPKRVLKAQSLGEQNGAREKWLLELLEKYPKEKFLLICKTPKKVKQIDEFLAGHFAGKRATFHEDLSLIERDRQAAYFAENNGARILVASEIGGEGRNFQFAHHLVLYDIPQNPDVLEQRIGRLDRIGQSQDVIVHVAFRPGTLDEGIVRFFHEAFNAFEAPSTGLAALFREVEEEFKSIVKAYDDRAPGSDRALEKFLTEMKKRCDSFRADLKKNLDVLVDLNSFDPVKGQALVNRIEELEHQVSLEDFMCRVWESFGIAYDELNWPSTYKLDPDELSFIEKFPGLEGEANRSVTFSREVALLREDISFLSLDHPMVDGVLSLLIGRHEGSAVVCRGEGAEEPIFQVSLVLESAASRALELERFLAPMQKTFHVTLSGTPLSAEPVFSSFGKIAPEELESAIDALSPVIKQCFTKVERDIKMWSEGLISQASMRAQMELGEEFQRLLELSRVNFSIPPEEIELQQVRMQKVLQAIEEAEIRVDAMRVIV